MTRKTFTREFKIRAVKAMESGEMPVHHLAMKLGLRRNQLYKWQAEIKARGEEKAFPGPGGHSHHSEDDKAIIKRLKKELARVSEERDILKKVEIFLMENQ